MAKIINIRTKLAFGFIAVIIILGLVSGYNLLATSKAEKAINEAISLSETSNKLLENTLDSFYIMNRYALTITSAELLMLREKMAGLTFSANKNLKELRKKERMSIP